MTPAREVPDPVQWHEGMLLAPQHFQQAALRGEVLLQYHLHAVSPFHWGVRQLRVDPVSLPDGTFRVIELEAVLPDGLVVTHDAGDKVELSVPLREAAALAPGKPLVVNLVVPSHRAGGTGGNGALPRYDSYEGLPVPDLNTGEGDLAIPRMRPRQSLLIADTPPDKFVSLPIAHVEYRDEAFVLTDYIPPLLAVTPQGDLGRLCAAVTQRVREKSVYLGDRARSTALAERTALLLDTEMMAESLSVGLPPVEAMLSAGVSHPYQLYIQMCSFVGLASAAGRAVVPPVFQPYNHANLRATFGQLAQFINGMLDAIHEEYRTIAFREAAGVFELALEAAWLRGPTILLGVIPQAGVAEADVAAWIDNSLISSKRRMAALRDRRIRGPARTRVAAADTLGIAPRRGEVIYSVTVDLQYVEAGEVLQILHAAETGPGHPREIVLYAANRA